MPLLRALVPSLCACSLLMSGFAQAELAVIADTGDTESVRPFLSALVNDGPTNAAIDARQDGGVVNIPLQLPLHSPSLTVGAVIPRRLDRPMLRRPLFLIGSDDVSLKWLRTHLKRLAEISAIGMLVQAEGLPDLRRIHDVVRPAGVSVMPAPGDDIARVLGIKHYPVLIWKGGIEQ